VRPRLGLAFADLVLGATVAALVLPVLFALQSWLDEDVGAISPATQALLVLWFGFIPAVVVGLVVGAVLAWRLRSVTSQWWHLLAFAGTGFAILAIPSLLVGEGRWVHLALPVAGAALAGRAALWRRFVPPTAGQCSSEPS